MIMLDPPDSVDVLEPQFKLKHKLRIFDNNDLSLFQKPSNSMVSASKYGLLFVCTPNCLINVIPLNSISNSNAKSECRRFPYRIVDIPGFATHLNINCDCTLLGVIVQKTNSIDALIYNLESFLKTDIALVNTINISISADIYVLDAGWNPAVPNIYSVCKSNGSLDIYELKKNDAVEKVHLPIESGSYSFSWSPKGKQIAVGSKNGNITQYKPDLKAVKVITAPSSMGSTISLLWVSNYQFIAIYSSLSKSEFFLVVIDAPKTGPIVYTNYDDICYSHGEMRSKHFYLELLLQWNTLIVASSNSSEVGVLGVINDRWTQFILADSGRAELPISAQNKQDTYPIGLVVDFISKEYSAPYLLLLSNEGLLSCYAIVYTNENAKISVSQSELPTYCDLLFRFYDSAQQERPSRVNIGSSNRSGETSSAVSEITQPVTSSGSALEPKLEPPKVMTKTIQKETLALVASNGKYNTHAKDTQIKIAKLIREDCCNLEAELNALFDKSRIQYIIKDNSINILEFENNIRVFVSEVTESLKMQTAEIQVLKQSSIQSWAWYEDVKSRFTIYSNPTMTTLLRYQPLDSACERQIVDMHYLIYYLESQLVHGNRSLDEQWELFQTSCKETATLQLPSTEMIYRTMVKHNATLQKQTYILNDISTRVQAILLKKSNQNLWISNESTQRVEQLQSIFKKLKLNAQNFETIKIKNTNRRVNLSTPRTLSKLKNIMKSRDVMHIRASKRNVNDSISYLTTLLATPTSLIPSTCDSQFDQFTNINFNSLSSYITKDKARDSANINLNTELAPLKEVSLPNPYEDQQRYIHLKRTHGFESSISHSAFASTLISRQHGTSDIRSQSEDLTVFKNSTPISIVTTHNQSESLFNKQNISSELAPCSASGNIFNNGLALETCYKDDTIRQNNIPNMINESAVMTINTTPAVKNKGDYGQVSCNISNKFVQPPVVNVTATTKIISDDKILNSSSSNDSFNNKIENAVVCTCEQQNNNEFTKSFITATGNTTIAPKELLPSSPFSGSNLLSTSLSTTLFTKSTTLFTTPPSCTIDTFTTPIPTLFTCDTNQNKQSNLFGMSPVIPGYTSNIPSTTLGISDLNTQLIPSTISSVTSGTSIATPIVYSAKSDKIGGTSIFDYKTVNVDNAENKMKPDALIGLNKSDAIITFKTPISTNPYNSFSFTKTTDTINTSTFTIPSALNTFTASPSTTLYNASNTPTNTSIFGSIPSTKENIFQKNSIFADNAATSNNLIHTPQYNTAPNIFGNSTLQQTGLQFGELNMASGTIFGGSNAPLNKNPFGQSSMSESINITSTPSIFGNNSTTNYNFNENVTKPSTFNQMSESKLFPQAITNLGLNNSIFNTNSSTSQSGFAASNTNFSGLTSFGASMGGNSSMFGSPPIFGNTPSLGTSTFGASNKIFGAGESTSSLDQQQNSTFANLANQNPTGFGNVTQSSPTPTSTGGSSFSSWR